MSTIKSRFALLNDEVFQDLAKVFAKHGDTACFDALAAAIETLGGSVTNGKEEATIYDIAADIGNAGKALEKLREGCPKMGTVAEAFDVCIELENAREEEEREG